MLALLAAANDPLKLPPVIETTSSGTTLLSFICGLVFNWIFTIAILLAVVLALYAAYQYLTSAGDPGKVKSATHTLLFVAVGIAVAIMARTIPVLVGSLISDGLNLDPCSSVQGTRPGK